MAPIQLDIVGSYNAINSSATFTFLEFINIWSLLHRRSWMLDVELGDP